MSCGLSLKLLPPPKKAWKSFSSKLQTKLHKIHTSRTIKKQSRPPQRKTGNNVVLRFSKLPELRLQRRIQLFKRNLRFRYSKRHYLFKRKTHTPVYVDKLFKHHAMSELLVQQSRTPLRKKKGTMQIEQPEIGEPSTSNDESGLEQGQRATSCGTEAAADDIWESLALESPQMRGIDQRAEEFIARFWTEMAAQETFARNF